MARTKLNFLKAWQSQILLTEYLNQPDINQWVYSTDMKVSKDRYTAKIVLEHDTSPLTANLILSTFQSFTDGNAVLDGREITVSYETVRPFEGKNIGFSIHRKPMNGVLVQVFEDDEKNLYRHFSASSFGTALHTLSLMKLTKPAGSIQRTIYREDCELLLLIESGRYELNYNALTAREIKYLAHRMNAEKYD
jgi:hypothetical protein